MSSVGELLREGSAALVGASESPRLDAEVLLCAAAKLSKVELISRSSREVKADDAVQYRQFIARRREREPVAYILASKEFFGLDFTVTPEVLIPRPDTETLVEAALEFLDGVEGIPRILDLGTGSGCIAIAIAAALHRDGRSFDIVATDQSPQALKIASGNAVRYGLHETMAFRKGNWWGAVEADEAFDLIVSNPPYVIEGDDRVSPEVHREPKRALYAADHGLADVLELLLGAPNRLMKGGMFLCEIGAGQSDLISARFGGKMPAVPGFREISFLKDLAGIERVLVGV